jgi:DNA-binding transcriptional MerR regulator
VFVAELARRVGRTPETIKRWITKGLLECERDEHNRRVFGEKHVERCQELAKLGVQAQVEQRPLTTVAAEQPVQLSLIGSTGEKRRRRKKTS